MQPSGDPASVLLQYGLLGLITLIAIGAVRILYGREVAAHQRDIDRADSLAAEVARLNASMIDRVLPATMAATEMVASATSLIQAIRDAEIAHGLSAHDRPVRVSTGVLPGSFDDSHA